MFEMFYAACLYCLRFYCYEIPIMLLRKAGLVQMSETNDDDDIYGDTSTPRGLNVSAAVVLVMGIICVFPIIWDLSTRRQLNMWNTKHFRGRSHGRRTQAALWRGNKGSALSIVDEMVYEEDGAVSRHLVIQGEIQVVDEGTPLNETTARLKFMAEYTTTKNKLSDATRLLESGHSTSRHDIDTGLAESREGIRQMRDAQQWFEQCTRLLSSDKESSSKKLLSKVHSERRKLSDELEVQKRKYQQLQDVMTSRSQKTAELEHQPRSGRRGREKINSQSSDNESNMPPLSQTMQKGRKRDMMKRIWRRDSQSENESDMPRSQKMQKARKRDVLKQNWCRIIMVLAGVGLTTAGSVTGIFPLAGAGLGMTLHGASQLKLSRKKKHQLEGLYDNHNGSSALNSSTATLNGAQMSNLFWGNNNNN